MGREVVGSYPRNRGEVRKWMCGAGDLRRAEGRGLEEGSAPVQIHILYFFL